MFNMDEWIRAPYGLSTLDVFDPFDELDHTISRNLNWLDRPDFLNTMPLLPKVPQKYRIQVFCPGFTPKAIKHEFKGNKLVVSGREESKHEDGDDFSIREFRKTFDVPKHAEHDKLVSFMAPDGHLVFEMPLKENKASPNADLMPQIVEAADGAKSVTMKFALPPDVDAAKASVMVKDRDLIFRCEDKIEGPDKTVRYFIYKRTTLPENTEFDKLNCVQDGSQIVCNAPLNTEFKRSFRSVPIEHQQAESLKEPLKEQPEQKKHHGLLSSLGLTSKHEH